jgi:Glycosyl transferase family 2
MYLFAQSKIRTSEAGRLNQEGVTPGDALQHQLTCMLRLTVNSCESKLKLYPFPADLAFGRSLHFIAALRVPTQNRNSDTELQLSDPGGAPVARPVTGKESESMLRRYFYDTLASYLSLYIRPKDQVVEIEPRSTGLGERFANYRSVSNVAELKMERRPPDYILLNGTIHYERDIQGMLNQLRDCLEGSERILFVYYSMLWKPLARFASKVGMRSRTPEQNWIAHEDLENFCYLTGLEIIRHDVKLLCPIPIPFVANFLNRYLAPLPFFRLFAMLNIVVARALKPPRETSPSVSVIVPARNESGNIDDILARCPMMGPADEVIFVEGHSTDDTWEKIQQATSTYKGVHRLFLAQQKGRGKGDAVRLGFELATNDILMILDADLTTPPEDLPKFYQAIAANKAEFVNGSRLVYPMEKDAMRFFNILGNKFFATAFSFVLGQRFKDTLCGTKVLWRTDYKRLAAAREFFGDFDPFGDFDLLFGAARMGLKIVEIPVHYQERKYGTTNIQRWRHGWLLLCMLLFAARRLKFLGHQTFHVR